MISPSTAAFAISIAKGLIKLGHRLDILLEEKAAVQGAFVLPTPKVFAGPSGKQMVQQLKQYLNDKPAGQPDDLLASDRADLVEELKREEPDSALVVASYRRVFPERLLVPAISPDAEFLKQLQHVMPALDLSDEDTVTAAFHVAAGRDERGLNYGARIGLLVVDVLAEFGAENTSLFVRDAGFRSIVQAVLQRFAQPDLEKFTDWSPFVRHALSATLNGVLDARTALIGDSQWLTALLDVLAQAREDKLGGDDFLVGLLQGKGYPLLLSKGLGRAAEVLAEDQADTFKQIAAEVLKAAAPLVASQRSFRDFFQEHWGDLLRAALASIERHGPALLEQQPELLRDVLLAMVHELAEIPQANLLSNETLFHLADAAIAAVAAKPKLLGLKVDDKPWLKLLLESFVGTVARQGVRLTFSQEGLESIITEAAGIFAQHPELIIDNPGLLQEVVGGVLRAVSQLSALDARNIATAATRGALTAIAENPSLMDTRYAQLIADFAARLAELVRQRTITGLEASEVAATATETLLRNPMLFDELKGNLATAVLNAVLQAAQSGSLKLLVGATLVATVREILATVACFGRDAASKNTREQFVEQLALVLTDGLTRAREELGHRLDLSALPKVLAGLVAAWMRSGAMPLEPTSVAFTQLFNQLAETASA